MEREYDTRLENRKKTQIRLAGFPAKLYLHDLKRDLLPVDAAGKLQMLERLDFVASGQNIILAGNPGTGKTHIAIGLGLKACLQGYRVYFTTIHGLLTQLRESHAQRTLRQMELRFERYDLVICDEFGYISFDKEGAELLFGGKDPSRASSLGNAFFGLGLFSVPLLINYSPSYSVGLMIMTGVSLAMLIPVFLTKFPEANLNYKFSVGFKLLGQLPVLIAAVAMMCSIGLDNAFKQWIPQVLTSMGTPVKEASLSISVFGLAMMSGRFILSTIRNMTAMSAKILIIASGVFAVIFYTLTISSSSTTAYILSAMAGLAAAPMFPSIVGITFSKYDRKYYGSIFGMIFSIGLFFAGMLMQVIGNISNKSSIQTGLKVPVVVALSMIVITIIMNRAKAKPVKE